MKNLSVSTFIHTLFSVAIAILIATFMLFLSWDEDRRKIEEFKRYQLISITFLSNLKLSPDQESLQKLYQELHLQPLDYNQSLVVKKKIEQRGDTLFSGGSSIGQVRVFAIDGEHYIYVQHISYHLLFKDYIPKNYFFEIAVGSGLFLIMLLLLLYLAVLKKLSPLKRLHQQILQFAQGNMDTRITYEYNDEIGKIAQSFDDAIVHIKELSASKNLFMRNLMHELKTPITKGRIVVEMLEDESTRQILVRAFERMNELISELAQIERVTTQSFKPHTEYVMLETLLTQSRKLLMTERDCVKVNIQNIGLLVDVKLMAIAIKNLLDNGLKYGKGGCVTIQTRGSSIEVLSKGEPLKHPLSYYIEPFSQEEKRSRGFGLGLYIVHNILEKLGYHLSYRFEAGENIFTIIPSQTA